MMPFHSWSVPGRKPGTSTKVSTGTLKASQVRTNRAAFSLASMSRVPANCIGWLATTPTERPSTRPKPTRMLGAHSGLHLEELAVVDDGLDDVVHVVGLVGAVRDDRVEREVLVGGLELGRVRSAPKTGASSRLLLGRYDSSARAYVEASSSSAAT